MKMEMHSHTNYSKGTIVIQDGVDSPEEIIKSAAEKGLNGIFITDHDVIHGAEEAQKYAKKYKIRVFKGEEVNTAKGHILALGIEERILPGKSLEETIDLIHDQGGIAVAAHPFDVKRQGVGKECVKCDAIEFHNSLCLDRFSNMKAKRFGKVNKLNGISASDAHSRRMIGMGITETKSDSLDSILKDIKYGRVQLVNSYTPARVVADAIVRRLQLSYPYTLNYINKNYSGPKRVISRKMLSLVNKSPGKIDYMFNVMTYISMGAIFLYAAARQIV